MSLVAGTIKTIITADDRNFQQGMRRTKSSLGGLENVSNRTSASVSGIFKGFAVVGVIAGITKVATHSTKLAAQLQQVKISINTIAGSSIAGGKLIEEIRQLANVTPFTSAKLFEGAKALLAFGFSSKSVTPTLRILGDIAAGTGKDIKELAIIYGQIRSAGRLMGQDLLQLINAGFNPLQQISEKTGRSMIDLKKDMEKGLITFDMVEQSFIDATSSGGKFFNLMEKQSNSFSGRLSTLNDKLSQIGENLGSIAIDVLAPVVDRLIVAAEALRKVSAGKGTAGQNVAVGAGAIAATGAAGGIGLLIAKKIMDTISSGLLNLSHSTKSPLLHSVGGLIQMIASGNLKIMSQLNIVYQALSSTITRVVAGIGAAGGAIIAVVAAIGVWLVKIKELNDEVGTGLTLWDSFKGGIDNLIDIIPFARDGINLLSDAIDGWKIIIESATEAMKPFADKFVSMIDSIFDGIGNGLNKLSRNFVNTFTGGKFGKLLDEGIFLEGVDASFRENLNKRARQKQTKAIAESAQPTAFDIALDKQIADDLMDIGLEFEETLRNMKKDITNILTLDDIDLDMQSELEDMFSRVEDTFKNPLKTTGLFSPSGLIGGINQAIEAVKGKGLDFGAGFGPFGGSDKSSELSAAIAKGSIEANSIINKMGEDTPANETADNTAAMRQILKAILDGGIQLKNVAVAN